MGQGSRHPDDKQQLIGLARRRAFETYLRFGRMPDADARAAERKALKPSATMPAPAPVRVTRYYVWRSTGDDRVRSHHAARHGQVFSWAEPPPGGHPGTEPNCRCWAAPYYGDPSVPDALQPLRHDYQVDATGTQHWTSIETLTRPDGSLAQSLLVARDGTTIQSRFEATSILRAVTLANGQTIRVNTEAGLQSVYLGRDSLPQFQSRWTATGPKVVGARQHLAFLLDRDRSNGTFGTRRPERNLTGGGGGGGGDFGLAAIAFALTAIQSVLQAAPASQGLGESDKPVMVVKTWALDLPNAKPVLIDAQTDEQLGQNCKHRDIVEQWALEAVAKAATYQDPVSPQSLGTRAHKILKDKVDAMSREFPELYGNLTAEISFVDDNENPVRYGTKGSSRLDILEDRRSDMGAICAYDMKTGMQGLTLRRLARIGKLISSVYPGTSLFYVIQVGPMAVGTRAR